ncbi:hypothetical protein ACOSQ2_020346 [Xanthoceras sorbifolium]
MNWSGSVGLKRCTSKDLGTQNFECVVHAIICIIYLDIEIIKSKPINFTSPTLIISLLSTKKFLSFWYQSPILSIKIRGKTNSKFRNEAKQYFEFKDINLTHHVQLASFHLEGIALQWHRWITKFRGPLTWEEFTKASLTRFDPTEYDNPSEALTRLKQTSTVAAYQEAFERLSHRVDGLPEEFLVSCFVADLKDEFRLDVKVKNPNTLSEAIGVA